MSAWITLPIPSLKGTLIFRKMKNYETNRDKAAWPKSATELNDVWTKIIKNFALSSKLAGKKKEETTEALRSRYGAFHQIHSSD
jgi:carboxyl-terminal processing protease